MRVLRGTASSHSVPARAGRRASRCRPGPRSGRGSTPTHPADPRPRPRPAGRARCRALVAHRDDDLVAAALEQHPGWRIAARRGWSTLSRHARDGGDDLGDHVAGSGTGTPGVATSTAAVPVPSASSTPARSLDAGPAGHTCPAGGSASAATTPARRRAGQVGDLAAEPAPRRCTSASTCSTPSCTARASRARSSAGRGRALGRSRSARHLVAATRTCSRRSGRRSSAGRCCRSSPG